MYTRAYARMRCIYTVFVRQAPSACAWCVSMSKIASPTVVSELIDDAKLQRYENNNPLYRGYNRPYIGERDADNQRVTSVLKNQVYLLISQRHDSRLLHVPFLLCQVLHIPLHFKRFPLRLQADFHGEGLGDIHGLLACGL